MAPLPMEPLLPWGGSCWLVGPGVVGNSCRLDPAAAWRERGPGQRIRTDSTSDCAAPKGPATPLARGLGRQCVPSGLGPQGASGSGCRRWGTLAGALFKFSRPSATAAPWAATAMASPQEPLEPLCALSWTVAAEWILVDCTMRLTVGARGVVGFEGCRCCVGFCCFVALQNRRPSP